MLIRKNIKFLIMKIKTKKDNCKFLINLNLNLLRGLI